MDDLLHDFLTETGDHLDTVDAELIRFERDPYDGAILANIFRLVHTIKGTCGFLGLPRLGKLAHAAEALMDRLRSGERATTETVSLILATIDRLKLILSALETLRAEPAGTDDDLIAQLDAAGEPAPADPLARLLLPLESAVLARESPAPRTVRVRIEALETLMTTVSELVLTRNQLLDLARRGGGPDTFAMPLQRLSQVTTELQDGILKARMQPVGTAWAKLPRLARDLSLELGKRFELVMLGSETELDRQIIEVIRDPLTHLVRNAADHALEGEDERRQAGKPPSGIVRLKAFQEAGTIVVQVADDGRGLDLAAIRHRAVRSGLVSATEAARLGDGQVADLIFHPGLSTTGAVSAVSGRGVGLDVVRTNIASIGGTVEVASTRGRGTTFTIRIPLTLVIVAAVIVRVEGQRFAIPQMTVLEFVRVGGDESGIARVNGMALLRLRGDMVPIIDVGRILGLRPDGREADAGYVVVVQVGRLRFGLLTDAVLDTEEIVVKPLSRRLRDVQVFSGNTILGDGSVALILDPNGVALQVGADLLAAAAPSGDAEETAPDDLATLLVFRGRDGGTKALPLSLVARLEEVGADTIEWIGEQPFLQYRGALMPVLPLSHGTAVRRDGVQPIVVVAAGGRSVGLAVEEIVDIVDLRLEVSRLPGRPDLVGTAVVRGRATEIVDLAPLLADTAADWDVTASQGEPATVLLVDDNPFFRDMLGPVLKAAGFKVRTAAGKADGLRILVAGRVDAVVVDVHASEPAGFDLVEAVRRHPATGSLPVVALASGPSEAMLRRARDLDIYDVVSKFDRSGLLAALADLRPSFGEAA